MKRACVTLVLLALGMLFAGPVVPAGADAGTVYDVFADFSSTANPTGAWSYGITQTLGGALTLYSWCGNSEGATQWQLGSSILNPKLGKNETGADISSGGNFYPGTTYIHSHPGPSGEYSVARWSAPASGQYRVRAGFMGLKIAPLQTTTDVYVLHNGKVLASGYVNASSADGEKVTFDDTVSVLAGDTVDFAVGFGSNGNYGVDRTGVRATIGNSAPLAPPAAPTDLAATSSYGQPVVLRWTDNSDNEDSFEVQRRTVEGAFSWAADVPADAALWEDYATQPQTEYSYRVRAKNSLGPSDFSNEASATTSALIPPPRPPTGLAAVASTTSSIDLAWNDNSSNEIAFEVFRRLPGGDSERVASTPANTWSYRDAGLPPDATYVYGVRSVSAQQSSFFCECTASTMPTLRVTALRGDLRDSPRVGGDSLKVLALFDFLPETPDGLFDPVAEGITVRAGDEAHPVVMALPGGLDAWKVRGTKATWRSARGSTPKYLFQVDLEDRLVKATARGIELAAPPANPLRVSVAIGDDAGTARDDWAVKKPGVFRLR